MEDDDAELEVAELEVDENVIDGYYRIEGKVINSTIELKFAKIQALKSAAMRAIIGKDRYINLMKISANNTINLLASYAKNDKNIHDDASTNYTLEELERGILRSTN